jgi:hypothetical protein
MDQTLASARAASKKNRQEKGGGATSPSSSAGWHCTEETIAEVLQWLTMKGLATAAQVNKLWMSVVNKR